MAQQPRSEILDMTRRRGSPDNTQAVVAKIEQLVTTPWAIGRKLIVCAVGADIDDALAFVTERHVHTEFLRPGGMLYHYWSCQDEAFGRRLFAAIRSIGGGINCWFVRVF